MIRFLLEGRRYAIHFISEGQDILKDFADEIQAQGSLAAVIRAKQGLAEKKLHPKDWKKFISQATKLSKNAISVMRRTAMVKTWTVTD